MGIVGRAWRGSRARVVGAVTETWSATRVVFGNPNLRRVNLALAGSMVGDWAFATAVTVWAYRYGGASAVGVFVAVRLALVALALPFLSVLVDRLPRKPFLITADLVRVVLVSVAAVAVWLDGPPFLVLALAVLAALTGAPFRPAQSALMPSLAQTPHQLTAANAVSSTLESLSFFLGPAIGALLLTVSDVALVFVFNTATFLWSAALLARLKVPAPAPDAVAARPLDGGRATRFLAEALGGFQVVGRDRRLLLVGALICAQTVVSGASMVFTVVVAVELVGTGPAGVGLLQSVLGVGAVLGGLLAISRSRGRSIAVDFGCGVLGWAVPPLLLAVWPSPPMAFLAFALMGLGNALVDVNLLTLVQRLTPAPVLGRVFGALESALIATTALGAFVMPVLIALLGVRGALAVVSVPIVAFAAVSIPALRRLDRTVVPPEQLGLLLAQPLFQPLPLSVLEGLARRLVAVSVPVDREVIWAGDHGDRLYLIEHGEFEATRGARVLSRMGPGDCFGEIALLRHVPRTATVVSVTEGTVHTLERDDFLAAMGAHPESASRAEGLVQRRIVR